MEIVNGYEVAGMPELVRNRFVNTVFAAARFTTMFICLYLFSILFCSCKKQKDDPVAPPAVTQFNKVYGGTAADNAFSIVKSNDGGYVFAGSANSNDGDVSGNHGGIVYHDAWVVKLDKEGKIAWGKAIGGSQDELANCIIPATGGGYIVAGATESNDGDVNGNHGEGDVWVTRLSEEGNIVWQKTFGGSRGDYANSIISTSDGGYIIVGAAQSNDGDVSGLHGLGDAWIIKLDKDGNLQWQKTLGGTNTEYFYGITETKEGRYVMAGMTLSNDGDVSGLHGGSDVWLVMLNKDGQLLWQKTLGGSGSDVANSIVPASDNGFILGGFTNSNDGNVNGHHGEGDAWVVKVDKDGNILWQKALGGSMGDNCNSIAPTSDNGYIMAGWTHSKDGDVTGDQQGKLYANAWIVKLDKDGNLQWQKILGGSDIDIAYSIIASLYGGYVMAGLTVSNDGDVSGNHGDLDVWVATIEDK